MGELTGVLCLVLPLEEHVKDDGGVGEEGCGGQAGAGDAAGVGGAGHAEGGLEDVVEGAVWGAEGVWDGGGRGRGRGQEGEEAGGRVGEVLVDCARAGSGR